MIEKKVCWWFRQSRELGDFGFLQTTCNIETVSGECDVFLPTEAVAQNDEKSSRMLNDKLHTKWAEVFKEYYSKPEYASLPKKQLIKLINQNVDTKDIGRLKNFKILCIEKKENIEGRVKVAGKSYAYNEMTKKVFMPVPQKIINQKMVKKSENKVQKTKTDDENQWD